MVDTPRTLSALQALFADNSNADISPQDLRDFVISVMSPTGFRVARATVQPLTQGAFTKVQYDVEDEDAGGLFDSTTNFVYTAPYNGVYQFAAAAAVEKTGGTTGQMVAAIAFFKNGSQDIGGQRYYNPSHPEFTPIDVTAVGLIRLAAGDTVDVRVYADVNSGTPRIEAGEAHLNHFSGWMVHP